MESWWLPHRFTFVGLPDTTYDTRHNWAACIKLIFVSVWDMNLTLWDLSINFVGSINMQNSAVKENICLQHYSYILQTACHKIIIKLIRDILYVITQWVCISIKEIVKQILIIFYIFIYFHFHFNCLLYKLCQS